MKKGIWRIRLERNRTTDYDIVYHVSNAVDDEYNKLDIQTRS